NLGPPGSTFIFTKTASPFTRTGLKLKTLLIIGRPAGLITSWATFNLATLNLVQFIRTLSLIIWKSNAINCLILDQTFEALFLSLGKMSGIMQTLTKTVGLNLDNLF